MPVILAELLPKADSRIPSAIGDLSITLTDYIARPPNPGSKTAGYEFQVLNGEDDVMKILTGDLIPHLEDEDKDWLLDFMSRMRAKAQEILPVPRMYPIVPIEDQVLSGIVLVQIEVISEIMGSMDVGFKVNDGNLIACVYNGTSGYYEKSVNTNGISNGQHIFHIRAQDDDNLLKDDFIIEVEN